jgi:hypothetical protein
MVDSYKDRAFKFKYLLEHWPEPGEIIECLDNVPAVVGVQGDPGRRILFTAAIIDDKCTGWFLRAEPRGVKVMIDMKDHEELIRRHDGRENCLTVNRIRVLRKNARETALIGELVRNDYDR